MRFECQKSCEGKCCKPAWDGKAYFVFLTKADREKLVMFLGQPIRYFAIKAEFTSTRFTKETTKQWVLNNDFNKPCRFLKNGRCSVYEARPTQCRTFPFWPELMVNLKTYNEVKKDCPGIGKGNDVTHAQLAEQIEADKELCQNL